MAAVPDLQWGGKLSIQVYWEGDDNEEEPAGADGAAAAAHLQRLNDIILDATPLCARGCHTIILHSDRRNGEEDSPQLGAATVAALATACAACHTHVQLKVHGCSVSPTFWAALPQHPPCVSHLHVKWEPRDSGPSTVALTQLVATYKGPPLQLFINADAAEAAQLHAALQLPGAPRSMPCEDGSESEDDLDEFTVEVQLPQLV